MPYRAAAPNIPVWKVCTALGVAARVGPESRESLVLCKTGEGSGPPGREHCTLGTESGEEIKVARDAVNYRVPYCHEHYANAMENVDLGSISLLSNQNPKKI